MTKATKHTPGPWWAGSDDDANMVYSGTDSVEAIADCGRDDGDLDAEAANAILCAAAPDLLAALEESLQGLHAAFPHASRVRDILQPIIEKARAAIAKAKG